MAHIFRLTGGCCSGIAGGQKEEVVMVDFKVGDRVRCGNRSGVVVEDDNDGRWPLRVSEDSGRDFWIARDGNDSAICDGLPVERAEPDNDELAELRSFKESAIARFPELAPVDPDLLEARRIASECSQNSVNYRKGDCDDYPMVVCASEAIKWARANPR